MKYRLTVHLTSDRMNTAGKVLYEGTDWVKAKDQFNFWSNEYRDEMDSITLRRVTG